MRILLSVTILTLAQFAFGAVNDVTKLNHLLQQKNVGWVAKSTPINDLPLAQARRMLGLRHESPEISFAMPANLRPMTSLPPVVDWRTQSGVNWVSPILDQANCGSCVAFAAIGVLETQYKIASGFSGFNIKLSPQNLFSCGGGSCDFGWQPRDAANYLQSNGVPEEACMPYTSGATGQDVACSASCSDGPRRSVKITGFQTPTRSAKDVDSIRLALQKGPLVTTLAVYADFMAYSSGVYKHVTGGLEGGHAVSIVGYDDTMNAFIIRNSWGEGWGENGFAHVSYDDISGIGEATWFYQMPSLAGGVTVEGPVDYTYASGQLVLKTFSTFTATNSQTISIFDRTGKAIWTGNYPSASCEQPLDISGFADGRYEIQAVAMDSTGQSLGTSPRQFFFVANQKPNLSLVYVGTNGTDLNKPLRGRIEVAITATSSTVPMSSVEFHYRGADGVDHSRSASVVVSGMTMGWRTNLGPSGAYDLWMIGHVKTNAGDTVVESAHKSVTVKN